MTFKEAFSQWSELPEFKVLATKNRANVQRVLMDVCGDTDVTLIKRQFVEKLLLKTAVTEHKAKVNAISVLVHILVWLHGQDPKHYSSPNFDYSICAVKPESFQVSEQKKGVKSISSEAVKSRKTEQIPLTAKKTRGKQPLPVAQLDATTLQVIKIWPSRIQVERELGAQNIDRAVKRKRIAVGFFWCNPEDVTTFQPNPRSKVNN